MPFVAQTERRFLEAARRARKEEQYWDELREAITTGAYRPSDFSLNQLFCHFVEDGHEIVSSWNPRHASGPAGKGVQLLEAGVDTSNFANITGQIVFSSVMDAWNLPAFIADQCCTTVPTGFSGEKIPGMGQIGDEAEIVNESEPYPMVGFSEEWVETPATTKRGFIVPVTKEAVFFDRTGILTQRASDVTTWLRVSKEKRVLDTVLGITTSYKRNGVAGIATYGDSSGTHDWDNLAASNALVDWTDIENAELLFDGMTDPSTGEPLIVMPDTLIVPSALKWQADRILSAVEIRYGDGASNTTQTIGGNPLTRNRGNLRVLSNAFVKARTSSASTWFYGQPAKAFYYMENWPIQSLTAPPNSEMEFQNDIIGRWKVTERGAPAVIRPHLMVKSTA